MDNEFILHMCTFYQSWKNSFYKGNKISRAQENITKEKGTTAH